MPLGAGCVVPFVVECDSSMYESLHTAEFRRSVDERVEERIVGDVPGDVHPMTVDDRSISSLTRWLRSLTTTFRPPATSRSATAALSASPTGDDRRCHRFKSRLAGASSQPPTLRGQREPVRDRSPRDADLPPGPAFSPGVLIDVHDDGVAPVRILGPAPRTFEVLEAFDPSRRSPPSTRGASRNRHGSTPCGGRCEEGC